MRGVCRKLFIITATTRRRSGRPVVCTSPAVRPRPAPTPCSKEPRKARREGRQRPTDPSAAAQQRSVPAARTRRRGGGSSGQRSGGRGGGSQREGSEDCGGKRRVGLGEPVDQEAEDREEKAVSSSRRQCKTQDRGGVSRCHDPAESGGGLAGPEPEPAHVGREEIRRPWVDRLRRPPPKRPVS